MRERTGYYDRNGKAICDGDKVKAIIGGQIIRGEVEEVNDEWYLRMPNRHFRFNLKDLDDIEILEEVT